MKIVILGAGRVGESVAESLVSERNDITLIDTDPSRLHALQERLDLRGVVGNGIQPSVLREAGIEDADMLISCAPMDETNLVVCKVAHDLFNVPTTIARIRSPEFQNGAPLLGKGGFGGRRGDLPRAERHRLYPQAHRIPRSPAGAGIRPRSREPDRGARRWPAGHWCSTALAEIPAPGAGRGHAHRRHLPARARRARTCRHAIWSGATRIEPGDEVFVLAATEHIRKRAGRAAARVDERPVKRLMFAGGGKRRPAPGARAERAVRDQDHREQCASAASTSPAELRSRTCSCCSGDTTDEDLLGDENVRPDGPLHRADQRRRGQHHEPACSPSAWARKRVLALINRQCLCRPGAGHARSTSPSRRRMPCIGELLAYRAPGRCRGRAQPAPRCGRSPGRPSCRGDRKTCRMAGRRHRGRWACPTGAQVGAIVRGLHRARRQRSGRWRRTARR